MAISVVRFIPILVFDVSSSMRHLSQPLQNAGNKFIKFLLTLGRPDEIRASVIIFSSNAVVLHDFLPLHEINLQCNFVHGYGTALYAGSLKAIDLAQEQLGKCLAQRKAPKVSINVFTDGYDTRSAAQLPLLKEKVRAAKKLGFDLRLFGIGIDVRQTAREMGFPLEQVVEVPATSEGIHTSSIVMNDYPTQIFKLK